MLKLIKNTLWALGSAMGYPPQPDCKTLFLKRSHSYVIKLGEVKLAQLGASLVLTGFLSASTDTSCMASPCKVELLLCFSFNTYSYPILKSQTLFITWFLPYFCISLFTASSSFIFKKVKTNPGMVPLTYNCSTGRDETGRLVWIQGYTTGRLMWV